MDNYELNIPDVAFKKDFTIIYKGRENKEGHIIESIEEIVTSQEEFLRKLRYFKQKTNEITKTNEIFIHDIYSPELFKEFIDSLKTGKIQVNDKNYKIFFELSCKYEYHELKEVINKFCEERPDIQQILKKSSRIELDSMREEKLSQNLDICLQNENFSKLPINTLNRILNSPKRVLKDHHLLFEFVKKLISNQTKENENFEEEENQILISCLDLSEMSDEDLEEYFHNEELSSIFNCRHSKERMKILFEEKERKEKYQKELEKRIQTLEEKFCENKKQEEENTKHIKSKLIEQEEKIVKYQRENEKLSNSVEFQNSRIEKLESSLLELNEIKNNFPKQEEIIQKYQIENESLKELIEKQNLKIKDLEATLQKLKYSFLPDVSITTNVEPNQMIKGKIKIIENNGKFDKIRSKYIINKNSSSVLGEDAYKQGKEIINSEEEFAFCLPSGTYFVHALIFDSFGNSKELISSSLRCKTYQIAFHYTGKVQSVTLCQGKYKLEVWGAEGGENKNIVNNGSYSGTAGKGGYSCGTLNLRKETTLYVYVGGSSNSISGGWNGGGSASIKGGAGGGGATDISLYGEEGSTEWNNRDHLYSRILVAGAGGGSSHTIYPNWNGGCGGGANGENNGDNSCKGGKQTNGFAFGIGKPTTRNHNSCGGGGWYGGYAYNDGGWGCGGGGGSGYVYNSSTASNYPSGCKLSSLFYLENSATISGNSEFPNTAGDGNEQGHKGDGYAKITCIE